MLVELRYAADRQPEWREGTGGGCHFLSFTTEALGSPGRGTGAVAAGIASREAYYASAAFLSRCRIVSGIVFRAESGRSAQPGVFLIREWRLPASRRGAQWNAPD